MNSNQVEQNLSDLIENSEALQAVLARLSTAGIRYGLYAGAHVAVLTGNRTASDIDMLVHDDDLPSLRAQFPFAKSQDIGTRVYLYVGEDDEIEFVGSRIIAKGERRHCFGLTDEAAARVTAHAIDGHAINLVDPVDSVVLKAIMQRGPEQGKRDVADIAAVLGAVALDVEYLRIRLAQAQAFEVATPLLRGLGVDI